MSIAKSDFKNKFAQIVVPAQLFLLDVQKVINESLSNKEGPVVQTVQYMQEFPGQHLRPFLVYVSMKSVGKQIDEHTYDRVVKFAASVELLHTASLLHDDVIDNETVRRGYNTVYKAFGAQGAILTGNLFYISALKIASQGLDIIQVQNMLEVVTTMCEGELHQSSFGNKKKPSAEYLSIIEKKTAALIAMACSETARIIGVNGVLIKKLELIGKGLGSMYQLCDDFADGDVIVDETFIWQEAVQKYMDEITTLVNELPGKDGKDNFFAIVKALTAHLI